MSKPYRARSKESAEREVQRLRRKLAEADAANTRTLQQRDDAVLLLKATLWGGVRLEPDAKDTSSFVASVGNVYIGRVYVLTHSASASFAPVARMGFEWTLRRVGR